MPELPEVEVVRRGLADHVVGRTLTEVEVLHERPVRSHPGGPAGFIADLVGRTVVDARRRGKYLWLPLDSGDAVLGHLGMSGQMLVQPVDAPAERHLRVRFALGDGPPGAQEPGEAARAHPQAHESRLVRRELRFVDQRMFGGLGFSPGGAELPAEIAHIARDLLDPEFDVDDFVRRARRRSSGIKRLLLDQSLVSGIGKIRNHKQTPLCSGVFTKAAA